MSYTPHKRTRWSLLLTIVVLLVVKMEPNLSPLYSKALTSTPAQIVTSLGDIQSLVVDGLQGPWTPSAVVLDEDNALHMVLEGRGTEGAGIYYVKITGKQVIALEKLSKESDLSINPDMLLSNGVLHVIWQGSISGIDQLYYRHQIGDTWGPIMPVATPQIGVRSPKIFQDDQNRLYIEWTEVSDNTHLVFRCVLSGYVCEGTQMQPDASQPPDSISQFVSQPVRTIAYLYEGDVYTIQENGANRRRLINSGLVTAFTWSPDGKEIAYIARNSNYEGDIYVMNADGSGVRQLTFNSHASRWVLDWHASRLVFIHDTDTYPMVRISYIDVTDPNRTIVDISPEIENRGMGFGITSWPAMRWSPNGQWIALSHGSATGIVAADGSKFHPVDLNRPEWKNDSSHVIHTASQTGAIKTFDPNNNREGDLSKVDAHIGVYSPDDTYVTYADQDYLKRMNANDTDHKVLVYRRSSDPDWSSNGDRIVFSRWDYVNGRDTYTGIRVANADGSGQLQLASGYTHHPVWQVQLQFRPNPDGYSFQNVPRPPPSWDVFKQTFSNSDMEYPLGIRKPRAWLFYERSYEWIFSGVCDGMSSTTLAYFTGIEARPEGATTTYRLPPNSAWPMIELYHGRQLSKGIQNYRNNLWRNNPGVDAVYHQIKSRLPGMASDPFQMVFTPGPNNSLPRDQRFGHAVIPYRIEEQVGSWAKVYVYDPNFPNFPGDEPRYFYFDFQSSPHSFEYDMGFPIPPNSGNNYRVQSSLDWVITLTPISEFTTYDAKVLHDGFFGWLIGDSELMYFDSDNQQLGYIQGVLASTIPNSAPLYQWASPSFSVNTLGFSLPAGEYQAIISNTGTYEYIASSILSTLNLKVQETNPAPSVVTTPVNGLDYIRVDSQYISTTYSSTLPTSRSLSLQIAGDSRQYGVLNATVMTRGALHAEATGDNLYLETSEMTSTFDLEIWGLQGVTQGWFIHRGITMTTSAAMTIYAPSIAPSSVVTISVAYMPNGPTQHTWILDNQIRQVYLPIIRK